MDQATIQEIAHAVAREAYAPYWAQLVVGIVLTRVVAGLAAYFGAYLKRKGENFATKEDFDNLRAQLQTNTRVVEEIKSEFGQRDWAAREWAAIRRAKLEELVTVLHEAREFVEASAVKAVEGTLTLDPDPFSKGNVLATL